LKFIFFLLRLVFIFLLTLILFFIMFYFLHPIFTAHSLIIPYAIYPFDICIKAPIAWKYIKLIYICTFIYCSLLFSNSLFCMIFRNKILFTPKKTKVKPNTSSLNLYVGKNADNQDVFINEQGLYQNILITGTIGSR